MAAAMLLVAHAQSQTRMRDIFAETPDSIFPMLSTNNKLDCIDLIENNMQARYNSAYMPVLRSSHLSRRSSPT